MTCDNHREAHDMVFVAEDINAARLFCKTCKTPYTLRKDERGVYEKRQAATLLRRLILQPNDPLFYKYHPRYLRT